MDKLRCTCTPSKNSYTYIIDVVADDESHAREMATACVREKSYFPSNVDTRDWNVSYVDSGYSGPARVLDYSKT
jgi:hypothetical protein